MALHGIMAVGIETAIEKGRDQLLRIATDAGLPPEGAEHLAQTVRAVPELLVDVDRALGHAEHPTEAHALWLLVLRYLLLDQDLIPTRDGQPIAGILDDAYFVHRAAQEVRGSLPPIDARSLDGGTALLRSVLPAEVTDEIDARITIVRGRARAMLTR